jgi:D-3-phosphoglycerate dehydrogenase
MKVIAYDPYAPAERVRAVGAELVSFEEALSSGDFFSLHMPLTSSTQNLFNRETFAKMKKGAFIINVARGGVIEDAALVEAIDNGTVKGAALDVFEVEPPAADHPLVKRPEVICTPHLGASTAEAQEAVAVEIAEAVVGALNGELSATSVNAPMVSAEVLSELAPYVSLTEKLGRIAVQLVSGSVGIKDVKVSYVSGRSDGLDTRLLRAMIVKGLVEPVSDTIVNIVNADYVAKQRGLRISEERLPSDRDDVLSSVSVQLSNTDTRFSSSRDESNSITVEGCVRYGVPYLTRVGVFPVDISLEGPVLFCRQVDQPGMIGMVGNLLAKDNVNISFMSVARLKGPRSTAVMAIGVDERPSDSALSAISSVAAIEEVVFINVGSAK